MPSILNTTDINFTKDFESLLLTKREADQDVDDIVAKILTDVKNHGDTAVIELTAKYDKLDLTPETLAFSESEIDQAIEGVATKEREALELAAKRIRNYHERQLPEDAWWVGEHGEGLGWRWGPVEAAGLYVPGGTASYPSSVLMNAIPASVAGVDKMCICAPTPGGNCNPLVLLAARLSGVKNIYRIGGAQAIGAMAYGTETIDKVDTITGPGNAFVAAAKRRVYGNVGIDMIAGPSEITVVGDKYSNPSWIASDLIAQAEHDAQSQSILISKDKNLIKKVKKLLFDQLKKLPRKSIAEKSLKSNGILISVSSDQKLIEVINTIAPEHLELNIKNYKNIVNRITNAGSIFLGKYSTEAVGDYLAGTNHVLPTAGAAKFSSGLSVYDFYKRISYINLSKKGIETLGPSVITLANFEGLEGHAKSVELRIRRK